MSLDNFIPTVWSSNLIVSLKKSHVFAEVANREYEGEISNFGDTVKVSQIGAVTVSSYTKNSTSITAQELTDAATLLNINQSNYFAFKIDDIDKAQQNPKVMTQAMRESAYAIRDTADEYIAGLYGDAGIARNTSGSPVDMTSANVEDEFLAVAESMDENNIPREGRFAIIPPWVHTKLVLAGISNLTSNEQVYLNGRIGAALGFNFLVSNNVSKNSSSWDQTRIICGVEMQSIAYAEQIISVEAYRPESSFSDAVKGLHVFGAKIIRPDMTAVLYADKTAEA